METTAVTPPEVSQVYNKNLLDFDPWLFNYRAIHGDLYTEAKRKYKPGGRKIRDYENLLKVYDGLYEWHKAKKENLASETENIEKRPVMANPPYSSIKGFLGQLLRASF